MRVGNIDFLQQGYGVLRNRGHDIMMYNMLRFVIMKINFSGLQK